MKWNLLTYPLILAALGFSSCSTEYNMAGTSNVEQLDGSTIYLRTAGDDGKLSTSCIDSCEVIHGQFSFHGKVDSVVFAQVCMGCVGFMPIVVEDGDLTISVDPLGDFVQGGKLNALLYSFLQQRNRCENELWEVEQETLRKMSRGIPYSQLCDHYDARKQHIYDDMENMETRFVMQNFDNALGPGYFMMLCDQHPFPVMTPQLQKIADHAPASFLAHPYISQYLQIAGYQRTEVPHKRYRRGKR